LEESEIGLTYIVSIADENIYNMYPKRGLSQLSNGFLMFSLLNDTSSLKYDGGPAGDILIST
jgi:hypothetical protein